MSKSLSAIVVELRRAALHAALRNINLHVFDSRATERELHEYVARELGQYPGLIRCWTRHEGVPREFVSDMLAILNRHSVWARHQLYPNKAIAAQYLGGER
ncbi:hypothetical protein [Photobacterium salinisoli]|uniref:hypothetical protein n=1 Tax=Photobacterium salinisoli TaxID=1616783 RepID=UPI000EA096D2|nr:hypothetical protein [Photobacterium salinisoli]